MTSDRARRVVLRPVGQDRHGEGCVCGRCNFIGKSYGVAIYAARDEVDLDGDFACQDDPLEVVYGPSEDAAWHNAKLDCETAGWQVVKLGRESAPLAIVEMRVPYWGPNDHVVGTRWIAVSDAMSSADAEQALAVAVQSDPAHAFRVCTDYGHVHLLPGHTQHIERDDARDNARMTCQEHGWYGVEEEPDH